MIPNSLSSGIVNSTRRESWLIRIKQVVVQEVAGHTEQTSPWLPAAAGRSAAYEASRSAAYRSANANKKTGKRARAMKRRITGTSTHCVEKLKGSHKTRV